jgi:hypothetical protein
VTQRAGCVTPARSGGASEGGSPCGGGGGSSDGTGGGDLCGSSGFCGSSVGKCAIRANRRARRHSFAMLIIEVITYSLSYWVDGSIDHDAAAPDCATNRDNSHSTAMSPGFALQRTS